MGAATSDGPSAGDILKSAANAASPSTGSGRDNEFGHGRSGSELYDYAECSLRTCVEPATQVAKPSKNTTFEELDGSVGSQTRCTLTSRKIHIKPIPN